jgi:D-alanine-D-alanine ligase
MEITLIKSYSKKPWRSPETFDLIESSLLKKWRVRSVQTQRPGVLQNFIKRQKKETSEKVFVYNIAEYLDESQKKVFLPGLLDQLKIPHLGSNADVVRLGLDKIRTKKVLVKNGIPTPAYFVTKSGNIKLNQTDKKVHYPLFVKPVHEGGHIGIDANSIVYNDASLEKAIARITNHFHQPALIEEYIHGSSMREFSVGIIDGQIRMFTPVEIDYTTMNLEIPILSFQAAQANLEKIKLIKDEKLQAEIISLANKTFNAVGARDYSRIDIRMDSHGLYVLEINIMPGLGPQSFLPEAANKIHHISYPELIQRLAEISTRKLQNL